MSKSFSELFFSNLTSAGSLIGGSDSSSTTTTNHFSELLTELLLNRSLLLQAGSSSSSSSHRPLPFQSGHPGLGSLPSSGSGPYGPTGRWNSFGQSNYGQPGQNWAGTPSGEENWNSWNRVFKLVLLSFVSTIGSMGSIFIISAITVIDTFQVRGNCYLVSLAFGHLIVTLAVLPASAIAIMANITEDADLCHFQWILTLACFIVTVLSFAFLALDNYCAMNRLLRYQRCCTKLRVFTFLLIIWTAAIAVPWIQHTYSWGPEFCVDRRDWKISLEYHPYLLGSLVFITLLTMVFFTRTLFRYKAYKFQLENSSTSAAAAAVAALESNFLNDGYLLQCNSFVYFVSLCMWLPMIVVMVIDPINPVPQHYLDTVWYLALANSCAYSYLYAATNRDFREAFNKLFYYCCCKSHVTFTRKGAAMRRTLANESMGLRVHIIPGLNIYAQRKETATAQSSYLGHTNAHGTHTSAHVFF